MARDNRVSVNVEDNLKAWIAKTAQKNHVHEASMFYILIIEQALAMGYEPDNDYTSTLLAPSVNNRR